jgi:hypothetical protein
MKGVHTDSTSLVGSVRLAFSLLISPKYPSTCGWAVIRRPNYLSRLRREQNPLHNSATGPYEALPVTSTHLKGFVAEP